MANILVSQFTLPNDENVYVIKDAWAREAISSLGSPMHFKGVFDELPATTDYSAGDVIAVGNKEYVLVLDGEGNKAWAEFGDTTELRDLAYADTASAEYTPAGTISKPDVNLSGNGQIELDLHSLVSEGSYTPAGALVKDANGTQIEGSVSADFVGSTLTSTGSYTPAGSLTNMSFVGTEATLTVSGQTITATGTFTPDVSIDAHSASGSFSGTEATISVSGNLPSLVQGTKSKVDVVSEVEIANAGSIAYDKMVITAPVNDNETLAFSYSTVTVAVSGASLSTDTAEVLSDIGDISYSAASMTSTGSYTPAGSVDVEVQDHNLTIPQNQTISVQGAVAEKSITYTPAGAVSGNFTGTEATITVTGTPTGSLSNITFVGESYKFAGTAATIEVEGQPAGSVDLSGISAELAAAPVFTGTATTITVTPDNE